MKNNDEELLFKKRLTELANKAYQNSQCLFTSFLSMAQQDIFWSVEKEISYVPYTLFGGTDDCERVMIRFGDDDLCGYTEPFPIQCVEISPMIEKFGEELIHRDYLGALMNLGIDRSTLGDIIIIGKTAYLFCTDKMTEYIIENLDKIRHTHVKCTVAEDDRIPSSTITRLERINCLVSSQRADSVVAKVYNLSRSQGVDLFREKKVFVNGRVNENNSGILKAGDKVSVRGFGKFCYIGPVYETKKGKLSVEVDVYR